MTAAELASFIVAFPEYATLAQAIAQGGFYILQDGSLASTALTVTGGQAIATYSTTGTALELAQASSLLATGSKVKTASIALAKSGTGYTAVGLTSLEMGTVAAACAPLLGVSLGVDLYQSNPALWTKLSQKLLPFCYPGTTKIPAWIDIVRETGAYKLLVKLGLIDALEEVFEEEGIGPVTEGGTVTSDILTGAYPTGPLPLYAGSGTVPSSAVQMVTDGEIARVSDRIIYADSKTSGNLTQKIYALRDGALVNISNNETTVRYSSVATFNGKTAYYNVATNNLPTTDTSGIYTDAAPPYAPGDSEDKIAWSLIYGTITQPSGFPEGTAEWTGTTPEVLPWTQPIIVIPDPVGPDYQPIETPVTPISPQIVPELPPHTDPIPLPPHVDPVEPIQPTEPNYPPDGWPEEEPYPNVIPFPWEDPTPDPENPWPEVMPWPLPEVPPSEWPTAPVWPTEVPIPQPWPHSPEEWPEENPWPEEPPEWWPLYPWPQSPEKWPEEIPWTEEPPESWPEELPWPDTPDEWPEELPWPEKKPDDWPDTIPWPDSPDNWPDEVPWPVPWPSEWPDDQPWPIEWPEELPYPWKFPEPVSSPDSDNEPDPLIDPTPEEVDPYIEPEPIPWTEPEPDPYNPDPEPPDPEVDPSQPQPIPEPPTDDPYDPSPPPPSGESPDPSLPIVPLPFSSTTGLITVYNPSQSELLNFANWLWVTWQDATIDKVWNNPFDGVISLFELYCTPTVEGRKYIRSGFLTSSVESNYISRYTELNCGSIGIPEYYGNYLDYAPYTKAYIYLPFIGVIELNADDIVGHAVNVLYRIDEYNGSCIAQITVARSIEVNGSSVDYSNTFYQFSGNCAVELPLSGGSQAAIKAGMLEAAAWGIGSVIGGVLGGSSLGQIGQGLAYGVASAVHSVVSAKSSVQHSGSFGSSYGAMGIKTPFITIVRPKQIQIPNYEALYGFPAHKAVIIGQCSGFLRCREVHIHSSTASDEEKALIEQMLKEGVIIGDSQ